MRGFLALIFLISVAFIPQYAIAEPAATIDELVAPYNVEGCADCHEEIHDQWKDSWHGKAIIDSRVLRTWRTFVKRGLDDNPQAERKNLRDVCIGCHAPFAVGASDELATEIAGLVVTAVDDPDKNKRADATKELAKLNINCLVCHNLKAVEGGGAKAGALYGPRGEQDPEEAAHEEYETIKSDYISTSEFCAQCHHGCPPDMKSDVCPTLYTSYKEKYLARGGTETCQGCHMKQPDPDELKSHAFPGIYEVEQVQEGIELTVKASPTQYVYHLKNVVVPAIVLNVQVLNKAGHGIPHG